MKVRMLRGARGENGVALAAGEIVEVSDELATILVTANRATTEIPAAKPKKRKKTILSESDAG